MPLEQERAARRALALEQLRYDVMREVATAHAFVVRIVVVDTDDVGGHALPAIVADHRSRGVVGLGKVVQGPHVVTLWSAVREVRNAPRLVEGHPGHDRWVAHV